MAIIDFDKSPGVSPEQRLQSFADSVRRAFDEITSEMEELKNKVEELESGGTKQ